jgi:hypothetical protein
MSQAARLYATLCADPFSIGNLMTVASPLDPHGFQFTIEYRESLKHTVVFP